MASKKLENLVILIPDGDGKLKEIKVDYFLEVGRKKDYFAIRKLESGNIEMYVKYGDIYTLHKTD